jgi:Flp pilus assembly protein TadB
MAPWIIIAAIGVAIAIVIAFLIERRSRRERQLEERRVEAGEHREKAELQALRAKEREDAARDELDRAERERAAAHAYTRRADEIDPDLEKSQSG